jgi:hypothetical protein
MCPHTSKIKGTHKVIWDKTILHKNSYTIPKGSLDEKCSEHAKTKINASRSKSHLSLDWNH